MTDEYLTAPGLLAHVFLAAGDRGSLAGWACLRFLWHNATVRFGLAGAVPELGVPTALPSEPAVPADGFGLLAAAESGQEAVWQALAWANHDLLCLTAMLAPARTTDCATAWNDLEQAWAAVVADLPAEETLGEIRVFLGLAARMPGADSPPAASPASLASLVRGAMPGPAAAGWWQHWDTVPLGAGEGGTGEALVWEAGPDARDGRIERRLAVVAAEDSERLVDHLLWTRGDGAPTPLTRHLMHAARLRHQTRVFDLGKVPRQVRDELDLLTGGLSAGLDSGQDFVGQDWLATRLWHTYMAAGRLRTRLDAMRQAVSVISENMRLALTLPATDASVGPLSEDRQLAAWFGQRLDDEIARLDGAVLPPPVSSLLDGEASRPARERGRAEFDGRAARGLRPAQPRQLPGPCVVVFTALEVEYNAIRDYLGRQITELKQRGTLYEIGSLPEVRGSWRVVLTQTGAGSVAAGVQLDRAIPLFEPDVAIFLGVAGGRKSVIRGDVVVADAIYDYEGGKSTREGYLPRMRTQYPAYHLVQLAKRITRQKRWQQRIRPRCPAPPPSSFVRPIVTGAKVVAHDRSAIARLIDQYASDALAIEMEGHGFLESAHMNPGVSALVIRGISDLLAGKDEANDGYWQPAASSHAAAFALELLDSLGMDQAVSLPPPVPRG